MTRRTPNTSPHLTRRDRRIVEHVVRYRLSTNGVIRDLFFSGQQPNAISKITARLCDRGYLNKFPHVHPRSYFLPGPRVVQEFGIPVTRTHPLGPQSLPTEYGVLAYATHGQRTLKRLTAEEIRSGYPAFAKAWLDAPHCLNESNRRSVLELIRVDLGGTADHVARKCTTDLAQRMAIVECRRLIETHRYRFVIVTGTVGKATAITSALAAHAWPNGFPIHLVAIADLLPLLPR